MTDSVALNQTGLELEKEKESEINVEVNNEKKGINKEGVLIVYVKCSSYRNGYFLLKVV